MTDLIKATCLWRKTSGKTGREYLTGRWGNLRVLVFENADAAEGEPTHLLMLGEAEDKRQPQQRDAPTRGNRPGIAPVSATPHALERPRQARRSSRPLGARPSHQRVGSTIPTPRLPTSRAAGNE
jgi:hypothetical protein